METVRLDEGGRRVEEPGYSETTYYTEEPLKDNRLLRAAFLRDYEPEDLADLLDGDVGAGDVRAAYQDNVVGYPPGTIDVGGETLDLSQYHERPAYDARVLTKFVENGQDLAEISEALHERVSVVKRQLKKHKLTT